jgi:hypothetical protein
MRIRERRLEGLLLLALILALPGLACGEIFTELPKGKCIVCGRMESVASDRGEFTIVDETGKSRAIRYTEDTVLFSTYRAVQFLHVHHGSDVIIRGRRQVVDVGSSEMGFCPLVILADRVYVDNAVR